MRKFLTFAKVHEVSWEAVLWVYMHRLPLTLCYEPCTSVLRYFSAFKQGRSWCCGRYGRLFCIILTYINTLQEMSGRLVLPSVPPFLCTPVSLYCPVQHQGIWFPPFLWSNVTVSCESSCQSGHYTGTCFWLLYVKCRILPSAVTYFPVLGREESGVYCKNSRSFFKFDSVYLSQGWTYSNQTIVCLATLYLQAVTDILNPDFWIVPSPPRPPCCSQVLETVKLGLCLNGIICWR
jgi:hypothetical protein